MAHDLRTLLHGAADAPAVHPDVDAIRRRGAARRRRHRAGIALGAVTIAVLGGGLAGWAADRPDDGKTRVGTDGRSATTTTTAPPGTPAASLSGTLLDGRRFTVTHEPPHGLCVRLGDTDLGCDDEGPVIAPDADPATPRTAIEDNGFDLREAGVLMYGFLPPGATRVFVRHSDGRETSDGFVIVADPEPRFWAIPIQPGDNPDGGVVYRDADGRDVPYVDSTS